MFAEKRDKKPAKETGAWAVSGARRTAEVSGPLLGLEVIKSHCFPVMAENISGSLLRPQMEDLGYLWTVVPEKCVRDSCFNKDPIYV